MRSDRFGMGFVTYTLTEETCGCAIGIAQGPPVYYGAFDMQVDGELDMIRRHSVRILYAAALSIVAAASLLAQQQGAAPAGQGRGRGPQTPPLIMTSTAW